MACTDAIETSTSTDDKRNVKCLQNSRSRTKRTECEQKVLFLALAFHFHAIYLHIVFFCFFCFARNGHLCTFSVNTVIETMVLGYFDSGV